ncbi:MAG TPA: bacteriorhodopsin, partial [Solirubrobacteraceae bacterium]|nr:bacteriorhodopsin [Solirubrobacteraceae bacterium]
MGVGAVAIAGLGLRAPRGQKHHFVMSAAVCAIAFVAYYAMANGLGIVHVAGRQEFYARYIDWFLTTPLLIGGLLMIGLAPRTSSGEEARDRSALIFGAVGADMFMILAGLAAGLTRSSSVKYGFYAISCIAFLVVLA